LHEKQEIARVIKQLGYNDGNKFFAVVSGDAHHISFDSGEFNVYGEFPIFHCSPLDSNPSCKWNGWSKGGVSMRRG